MKIFVKAKPNSKTEEVEKIDETHFTVRVKEPAREDRANVAIVRVLAEYFKVPQSRIQIASGFSAKNKIIEINL